MLDTTVDVATRHGELFAALRHAGTPLPVNGIWIAAATLACGGHLVTFDADFARIAGLPHALYDSTAPGSARRPDASRPNAKD